jgi:hypothetical protein
VWETERIDVGPLSSKDWKCHRNGTIDEQPGYGRKRDIPAIGTGDRENEQYHREDRDGDVLRYAMKRSAAAEAAATRVSHVSQPIWIAANGPKATLA